MKRGGEPLVLDASVAVALVRPERLSLLARRLVVQALGASSELLAPSLMWLEAANALVRDFASPSATMEALHDIERFGVRTVQLDQALLVLAVGHAHARHLTPYDALYLALAETEDGRLATADRALAAAVGDRAILVSDDSTGVHEAQATYGALAGPSPEVDPDAWPGFDRYVARLRDEAKARPSR